MVAAGIADKAQAWSGDRRHQQEQAHELEQETPRLLDAAAMLKLGADVGADPEAQGRYHLVALGTVQQVQRDDAR